MPSHATSDRVPATRRLRIMVCPHELIIGGSQINAIDLAALMRRRGHDVEVYAPPGPLLTKIESYGLPFVPAPARKPRELSLHASIAFARELRRFRPDIVHTYESPPTIVSATVSAVFPHRNVATVLSMTVPDYLPEDTPLLVGTAELVSRESWRRRKVYLMEPPVDAEFDAPGDPAAARSSLAVSSDQFVVAVVGRLSTEHHKAHGVISAIQELGNLDLTIPITLLVAGSGDKEAEVRLAAERARSNLMLTVRLEGNVIDPRSVYDAADVVFGMGSSALRAMSHAKPLIVQGGDGFWELLEPDSVDRFLSQGYFGQGPSGGPSFAEVLLGLAADPERRAQLGNFGRTLVLDRYTIQRAVESLESVYAEECERPFNWGSRARSVSLSLARYVRFRIAVTLPWIRRAYRSLLRK